MYRGKRVYKEELPVIKELESLGTVYWRADPPNYHITSIESFNSSLTALPESINQLTNLKGLFLEGTGLTEYNK